MSAVIHKLSKYTKLLKKSLVKFRNGEWRRLHAYPKYYDTLPIVPKTILLESQHGREFEGIIFSIASHLAQTSAYDTFEITVVATKEKVKRFREKLEANGLSRLSLSTRGSKDYYRRLATSNYLINDNTFLPFFVKKEGQIYLNTWHGTPLKTLGCAVTGGGHLIGNAQKNFFLADYLLVPNEHTDSVLRRDYQLDQLAMGKRLFGGYPRNTVFFESEEVLEVRKEALGFSGKRLYAYLPTYRGDFVAGATSTSDMLLRSHLLELDRQLSDDECLLVNLHPVAKSAIDFSEFKRIQTFPVAYNTYEVLAIADVLITDYSSVFFDFACTRKKIVLFTYDQEEYLRDRGMYFSMEALPFPKVTTPAAVLDACRREKRYDDTEFLKTFCPYEGADATEKLCRHVILGERLLREADFPKNGKENVLIYAGNLAQNGITTALFSLLKTIDCTRRNYILLSDLQRLQPYAEAVNQIPPSVSYVIHHGDVALTYRDRVVRMLFKLGILNTQRFMRLFQHRFQQDTLRTLGTAKIDSVIHFTGYEDQFILWFSTFKCRRMIYAHSDMCHEVKTRGNARQDVYQSVYNQFEHVVAVTRDLIPSTQSLISNGRSIDVVRNMINYRDVLEKSTADLQLDADTLSTHSLEQIQDMLADASLKKVVSVGRFSPEKGHLRLLDAFKRVLEQAPSTRLFIIGGNSYQGWYQRTLNHVIAQGLQDQVVLICKVSNPFPFVKACDGFVLSSFYEGFGLVLAEADILGLPVISTDIVGPRLFMQANGGTLVDNSEEGLYQGMRQLLKGEIKPMHVDYEAYNQENVRAFEALFADKPSV